MLPACSQRQYRDAMGREVKIPGEIMLCRFRYGRDQGGIPASCLLLGSPEPARTPGCKDKVRPFQAHRVVHGHDDLPPWRLREIRERGGEIKDVVVGGVHRPAHRPHVGERPSAAIRRTADSRELTSLATRGCGPRRRSRLGCGSISGRGDSNTPTEGIDSGTTLRTSNCSRNMTRSSWAISKPWLRRCSAGIWCGWLIFIASGACMPTWIARRCGHWIR